MVRRGTNSRNRPSHETLLLPSPVWGPGGCNYPCRVHYEHPCFWKPGKGKVCATHLHALFNTRPSLVRQNSGAQIYPLVTELLLRAEKVIVGGGGNVNTKDPRTLATVTLQRCTYLHSDRQSAGLLVSLNMNMTCPVHCSHPTPQPPQPRSAVLGASERTPERPEKKKTKK